MKKNKKDLVRTIAGFAKTYPRYTSAEIWQGFLQVVNQTPGVTVLNSIKHDFPGGGFSGLVLLAESHAAIHTWPERNLAWVELATCGDPAGIVYFYKALDLSDVIISHPGILS